MTDPQQAAIDAAEDALRADIWDGDPEDIPPTMEREAELAVAARIAEEGPTVAPRESDGEVIG